MMNSRTGTCDERCYKKITKKSLQLQTYKKTLKSKTIKKIFHQKIDQKSQIYMTSKYKFVEEFCAKEKSKDVNQ